MEEVKAFLEANPAEIVTIFIEDYVTSPNGLTKVFDAAELRKYWFPVSSMPKNGESWPTVDDMIHENQRLVVFTSKSAKEASEGIAYQWRYVVENQCELYILVFHSYIYKQFLIKMATHMMSITVIPMWQKKKKNYDRL